LLKRRSLLQMVTVLADVNCRLRRIVRADRPAVFMIGFV
jgi:hypothetical protein